jgi:hypothetical protein
MPTTEEFDSFEPFEPISVDARPRMVSPQSDVEDPSTDTKPPIKRQLTPVNLQKVEFWHSGESPTKRKIERYSVGSMYARRADELGIFLFVFALLVLVCVVAFNRLTAKKYLITAHPSETTTAVVDFYQGNHAFSQTEAEERAYRHLQEASKVALSSKKGHVYGDDAASTNSELEVPILEQMKSMTEEIQKMRLVKQAGEAPPPAPDHGVIVDYPKVPVAPQNFESPDNLKGSLPSALQTVK